MLLSLE